MVKFGSNVQGQLHSIFSQGILQKEFGNGCHTLISPSYE
jgi:hypothetical protein